MERRQLHSRFRFLALAVLLSTLVVPLGIANPRPVANGQDGDEFDFTINEAFLNKLASDDTLVQTMNVKMQAHSSLHSLSSDCEMHVAGSAQGVSMGSPSAIVVEPPNLCLFVPPGVSKSPGSFWPKNFDDNVISKTCEVKGFFRIFTEHASGTPTPSNPNHVFEVHPALSIKCGDNEISFKTFLSAPEGLRAIKATTATICMTRSLQVRFKNNRYEFQEGTQQCGNFAIIEITNLNQAWVHKMNGGHSAIARVSADGLSTTTLKLYTLEGTDADDWMEAVRLNGMTDDRKLFHGLFTYDYQSIIRTLKAGGNTLTKPSAFTTVRFPMALVVFGDTETVPWEEQ